MNTFYSHFQTPATTPSYPNEYSNPIHYTTEEMETCSKWKKYMKKIHELILTEYPNMCLTAKTNTSFKYESSTEDMVVAFECRFEGDYYRRKCVAVIKQNGITTVSFKRETPKRLYKCLENYIDISYINAFNFTNHYSCPSNQMYVSPAYVSLSLMPLVYSTPHPHSTQSQTQPQPSRTQPQPLPPQLPQPQTASRPTTETTQHIEPRYTDAPVKIKNIVRNMQHKEDKLTSGGMTRTMEKETRRDIVYLRSRLNKVYHY